MTGARSICVIVAVRKGFGIADLDAFACGQEVNCEFEAEVGEDEDLSGCRAEGYGGGFRGEGYGCLGGWGVESEYAEGGVGC